MAKEQRKEEATVAFTKRNATSRKKKITLPFCGDSQELPNSEVPPHLSLCRIPQHYPQQQIRLRYIKVGIRRYKLLCVRPFHLETGIVVIIVTPIVGKGDSFPVRRSNNAFIGYL